MAELPLLCIFLGLPPEMNQMAAIECAVTHQLYTKLLCGTTSFYIN